MGDTRGTNADDNSRHRLRISEVEHDRDNGSSAESTLDPAIGNQIRMLVSGAELGGPGSGPTRVAAMQGVQRTLGNRAAQRIVQRKASSGPARVPVQRFMDDLLGGFDIPNFQGAGIGQPLAASPEVTGGIMDTISDGLGLGGGGFGGGGFGGGGSPAGPAGNTLLGLGPLAGAGAAAGDTLLGLGAAGGGAAGAASTLLGLGPAAGAGGAALGGAETAGVISPLATTLSGAELGALGVGGGAISPLATTLSGAELGAAGLGGGAISPLATTLSGAEVGALGMGGAGGTAIMGAAPTIPGAALAGGGGSTVVMGAAPTIPGAALAGGGGSTVVMGSAPTIPGAALAGGGVEAGALGGVGAEAGVAGAAGGVGAAGTVGAVLASAAAGAAIGYGLQKGSGALGDYVAGTDVGKELGMVQGRDYSIGGGIGNALTAADEGMTGMMMSAGLGDSSQPAYQQTLGKRLADWLTPTSNA